MDCSGESKIGKYLNFNVLTTYIETIYALSKRVLTVYVGERAE